MNDYDQDSHGILNWLLSLPGVPRPLLAALWGLWWIYFTIGAYLENSHTPGQVWWLNIWHGSLGGNAFSAYGATVLSIILTGEVIFMVLTLLGNRRRIIDARKAAEKEAAERVEKAEKEAAERAQKAEKEAAERAEKIAKAVAEMVEKAVAEVAERAEKAAAEVAERAEKAAAEAVEKALAEATSQSRLSERQEWQQWYQAVKPDLEAGRPPSIPPPATSNGSTSE